MADDVEVQERDCGHRTCPQYSRNIKLAIMTLRWVYSTGNVEQQRVIIEKRPYVWVCLWQVSGELFYQLQGR